MKRGNGCCRSRSPHLPFYGPSHSVRPNRRQEDANLRRGKAMSPSSRGWPPRHETVEPGTLQSVIVSSSPALSAQPSGASIPDFCASTSRRRMPTGRLPRCFFFAGFLGENNFLRTCAPSNPGVGARLGIRSGFL